MYNNNPGYGYLELNDDNEVKKLIFRFAQLEDFTRIGQWQWTEKDVLLFGNFDINDGESIREWFAGLLYDFQAFAKYEADNFGLRGLLAQVSQFFWPFFNNKNLDNDAMREQIATVCAFSYYNQELFPDYCKKVLATFEDEE